MLQLHKKMTRLPVHNPIRPIFSIGVHSLLQNVFDLSIGNLNLSTHLWVIWGGNLMSDEIFPHQLLENPVAKMLTSITYDCLRCTKMSKDSLSKIGPQLCGHWSCMQ